MQQHNVTYGVEISQGTQQRNNSWMNSVKCSHMSEIVFKID